MLKRLLVFGLGTSLVQVMMFYSFIFIVYWFAAVIAISYPEKETNPDQDYVVLFTAIVFAIIALFQNVVAAIIHNKKATYTCMAIAIAAYTVYLIDIGFPVSFKTGLCFVLGLVVLGIKTRIDDALVKWWLT